MFAFMPAGHPLLYVNNRVYIDAGGFKILEIFIDCRFHANEAAMTVVTSFHDFLDHSVFLTSKL